jgi:hypothetical protein
MAASGKGGAKGAKAKAVPQTGAKPPPAAKAKSETRGQTGSRTKGR